MADYQNDNQGNRSGFGPTLGVYGQWGDSGAGIGVVGTSAGGSGIYGESRLPGTTVGSGGAGVTGVNDQVRGVGVRGIAFGSDGLGVYGGSIDGSGVQGDSDRGVGVWGTSSISGHNFGVMGTGPNAGVAAFNPKNNHAAYLASEFGAAWFTGNVHVAGRLTATEKNFLCDHPLDKDGKFLVHASVESSERKNIYDGTSVLDSAGEAEVELPAWFEALNGDFRYQLTPIGCSCPNLFIAKEMSNNRFRIGGGNPKMKVSWQVTGVRKDSWALAHPFEVEMKKSTKEIGLYLHPELNDAAKEKSIEQARHPRPVSLTADLIYPRQQRFNESESVVALEAAEREAVESRDLG